MNWQNQIRESAYTSPNGTRMVFIYENVSQEYDRKTAAFNFPDTDGTFIQDLGSTGRRFPFKLIFTGDDHLDQADQFDEMLRQRGVGRLEHPVYGVKNVVPFGPINRIDALKTAANQTIFELTFWETIEAAFPNSQNNPTADVLVSLNTYDAAAAAQFNDTMSLDTVTEEVTTVNRFQAVLDATKSGLQAVADTIENVQKQFNAVYDSINNSIDILIGTPLALAQQTIILAQSPARALTNIEARLDAYKNLADSLIKQADGTFNVYADILSTENNNAYHTDELYAMTYTAGSVLSVINNQFDTASDAIAAADFILNQFDELVEWRDLNYQSLGQIDTGEAYQALQQSIALTVGFLVQISFTLRQERTITLDRDRTIIDLCAELYGEVDEQLDFMINSNNLAGFPGILELKQGQTILYYV